MTYFGVTGTGYIDFAESSITDVDIEITYVDPHNLFKLEAMMNFDEVNCMDTGNGALYLTGYNYSNAKVPSFDVSGECSTLKSISFANFIQQLCTRDVELLAT